VSRRARRTVVKVALVLAAATLGFALLQAPARHLEATTIGRGLELVTRGRVSTLVRHADVLVTVPPPHDNFAVTVSPACSALASVLALGCLGSLGPRRDRLRELAALAAAVVVVIAGNLVRMTASLWVGTVAGRGALVMFHDWVGAVFTFAYTLFGYVLLLYLVLPRRPLAELAPRVPGTAIPPTVQEVCPWSTSLT
jgi:exosortase/archaeosortase family protein